MSLFKVSLNGLYFVSEERIYSLAEDKSYNWGEFSIERSLQILKENSIYAYENKLVDIYEIVNYQRRVTYQLLENFSFDMKTKLMLEFDYKYGRTLITESTVLMENWLSDAWNWTADKVKSAGGYMVDKVKEFGSTAVKSAKDLLTCITGGKCSPFFEDFRQMLYNPVGIAIETFLNTTGVGSIVTGVAWGVMALYDVYLAFTNYQEFHWMNLIADVLGIAFSGLAKAFMTKVKGLGLFAKTQGKGVGQVVQELKANPGTAEMAQTITKNGTTILSKSKGVLTDAGKFMSEKMGLKWVGSMLDKATKYIADIIESFGVKSIKGTTQQAVKSSAKQFGVASAITGAADSGAIGKVSQYIGSMLGGDSSDELMKKLGPTTAGQFKKGVDY
jgi:hypothetical protein